jgi:PAS domain S-box-containing protein
VSAARVAAPGARRLPDRAPAPPQDALASAKVLLVDDRIENLVTLEAVLQPLGHELIRATSGEDALRQVLRHDFALILLDVQMPNLNGFETAQLIKSRERSRDTPIIFLTAISKDEEFVFRGYSTGAVDYLFKPFHPDILRSKVSVLVDLHLKGREIQRQSELLRQSQVREVELRHRARLLESEARYAQIVNSATDSIISYGEDRAITVFNAAAEHAFGVRAQEALGRAVDGFLRPDGAGRLLSQEVRPAREGEGLDPASTGTMEGVGVRADGSEFPVEFSISSLVLDAERFHTVILRDISERRRAAELLRIQNESLEAAMEELRTVNEELHERTLELERAMGSRSRFYASMSHELRTPINAILGYSALLLDDIYGPLTDQQRESVRRTNRAANQLLDLVNDILDLSKIEAGKMELQYERILFPDLMRDLFATVAPLAQSREVELTLDAEESSWSIVSDPRKIRQIALNLLSNAIKFGGGKPVRVSCARTEEGELRIDVQDQGAGISQGDVERVFEEFVQLETSTGEAGTGLGLPISRRLAEHLGGSLTVVSEVGLGSTFTLRVPDAGAAKLPDGEASGRGASEGGEGDAPTPSEPDSAAVDPSDLERGAESAA